MRKILGLLVVAILFVGCLPAPKPTVGLGAEVGNSGQYASINDAEYGASPRNYVSAIRSYFSVKLKRGSEAKYKYSLPKRAYKRKGLAYGGDIAWKGWLVETSVAVPTRRGRFLTPRPYMVLFSGEQIVEDILGNSHKLLTKVDK